VYLKDISLIRIELDINNKQSLYILLAKDGSISRLGHGHIDEPDQTLYIGETEEPLFEQLLSAVSPSWSQDLNHLYIIPNDDESQIKGAHCKLVIDFQFPDEFKRIEFHYGSDSEGLPPDIYDFIQTAIELTNNWIEKEYKYISPGMGSWGVTLGVSKLWARGLAKWLSDNFARELAELFASFGESAQVNQNKVIFKNEVFEMKAEVKNGPAKLADGVAVLGILVEISIIDKAMPSLTTRRLTTGAVGYGHGPMEAFQNAVSEWGGLVAQAIVGSCLERTGVTKRGCLRIGHHRICPGGTAFSGATADTIPSGWKWEQHARLLELINNKLPDLLPGDNLLHSISLTIMISPTGGIESGSVFFDANEFPEIIAVLRDFDWPITSGGYMFKQFYLIDRCI